MSERKSDTGMWPVYGSVAPVYGFGARIPGQVSVP